MKLRSTLLLGGAVLFAVAPVWADKIPYPGSANEPRSFETSAKETGKSTLNMSEPVNAEFRTAPAPVEVFAGVPMSADVDNYHVDLDNPDSHDRVSFFSRDEMDSREVGEAQRPRNSNFHVYRKEVDPVPAAEPGSLSLMLLGLAAVGFLARRRGESPTST
ncbi:MAG: PEP-CTERM sorting domain-containing protein [Candidatus Acidiferrales bacterium]